MTSNIKLVNAIVLFILICVQFSAFSQNEECQLIKSKSGKIYTVDSFDLICLAQTSQKEKILIYSFATWCKPCRYKLPSVLRLSKDYDLELFILLRDEENSKAEASAIDHLRQINETINADYKTYILKDENGSSEVKYRRFIERITPVKFENVPSMGKFFLVDKSGEVLMVTSWKDRVGKKWKNNTSVIDNKILPFLN